MTTPTPRLPIVPFYQQKKIPKASEKQKAMNTLLLLLLILHTHLSISSGKSDLGLNSLKNDEFHATQKRVCGGQIGECAAEFEMDSEVSRRMLAMQKKYISYETLRREMVPCTEPGASYYNCGSAEANHYSRGCDVITRCARNIKD